VVYSLGYGRPSGFGIDPIEKKPLNHFLPGSSILSFGTLGCNLGCKFCQNWSISKVKSESRQSDFYSAEEIVLLAKQHKTPSIAFTYNDPVIFGEYVLDISEIAKQENIKSVMVTAGYVDPLARKEIFKNIDAANVDLKAFTENFYYKNTLSHISPVLDTLIWLKNETDVWIELTTLLIPGQNDSENEINEMCNWILENLGDSVPLHFTAFHPSFRMMNIPSTRESTVLRARQIALAAGIKFCYVGNMFDKEGQATRCPACKTALIQRDWHSITEMNMYGGLCPSCGAAIAGVF
jgi:pyruvate formate lyase activating enzyme